MEASESDAPLQIQTLSPDYKPAKLKSSMLHIVTQAQLREDSKPQFDALTNPRYRIVFKSDSVMHHDFTIWGRIIGNDLHQRGQEVNEVFSNVSQLIYDFLVGK
jgi:hypothetical protein